MKIAAPTSKKASQPPEPSLLKVCRNVESDDETSDISDLSNQL